MLRAATSLRTSSITANTDHYAARHTESGDATKIHFHQRHEPELEDDGDADNAEDDRETSDNEKQ